MSVFILPTQGATTYRGKYPTRARVISSGATGLHVELNNGVRLWALDDMGFNSLCANFNKADFAEILASAVTMTDSQYATLKSAAAMVTPGASFEVRKSARAMAVRIQAEAAPAPEVTSKPKLPAPNAAAARTIPGEPHAGTYTREELDALAALRRSEQFTWRGWHYLACEDAREDTRTLENGATVRRVSVSAVRVNPAMRSGWELADVLASRIVARNGEPCPDYAGEAGRDFPGGGVNPALRSPAYVQRRNADGGLRLYRAADLAGTPGELRARAADNRRAGNYGLAYVQEREAERIETPEAFTPTADAIDESLADYIESERAAGRKPGDIAAALREALADVTAQDSDASRFETTPDGALRRTRFEVTGLDASADGMERLRDQSEFILLAYPTPYGGAGELAEAWAADVDSCARPDGFDFEHCREAVRAWARDNAELIESTLKQEREWFKAYADGNPWDAWDDTPPTFRLYIRDVNADLHLEPNAEELAAQWDAAHAPDAGGAYGVPDQFDSVIRDALRIDAARQDSGREPESRRERLASDAIAALCAFHQAGE